MGYFQVITGYLAETGNDYIEKSLLWHNKKDVDQVLEAMQKWLSFFSSEKVDMLKFGKMASICLHKSTNEKLIPFFKSDRDLC